MYIDLSLGSGNYTTTSYSIAKMFNKKHKTVLKEISNLSCSNEFKKNNFLEKLNKVVLPNFQDKYEIYYLISRDGFLFLLMAYTGEKASEIKEKYITIFSNYERILMNK